MKLYRVKYRINGQILALRIEGPNTISEAARAAEGILSKFSDLGVEIYRVYLCTVEHTL